MNESTVTLKSPQMRAVYRAIQRVAQTNVSVLITGETGVGKEIIAQAIHNQSLRRDKPFKVVNCGAFHRELLSSELFGHEKGAFTGATAQRRGMLEQADGGTLFLDEVGEMFPELQPMFLRTLETQTFTRLGGNREIRVDVRVIAATNSDMETAIYNKQFREDLYFRLNGFQIHIPPLWERPEDIPPLVSTFISQLSMKYGKKVVRMTPEALYFLKQAAWPGNIRELKNVIGRAILETDASVVGISEVSLALFGKPATGILLSQVGSSVKEAFYPLLTHISLTEFIQIFAGISPDIWKLVPKQVQRGVIREASFYLSRLLDGHQGPIRLDSMTKDEILSVVAGQRLEACGSLARAAASLDVDVRTLKEYLAVGEAEA